MKKLIFIVLTSLLAIHDFSFSNNLFTSALDIAFDNYEFLEEEKFSISPNNRWIAYSVKKKPSNVSLAFQLSNGTPPYSVGSRLFITHLDNQETLEIGPEEGDCWRPSWSPNGQKLAFYSKANDVPQLWIYDVVTSQSHQISHLSIKAIVPNIDAPIWSLDSKMIYIPLNPIKTNNSISSENLNSEELVKVLFNKDLDENQTEIQDATSHMQNYYQSTLVAIHLETRSIQTMVSTEANPPPGFLKISPTGQWLSYMSIPRQGKRFCCLNYDLAVIPTNGQGTVTPIKQDIQVDNLYQGVWHPHEDKIAFIQDSNLYLAELDDHKMKSIAQVVQNSPLEFIPHPLSFTEDGKKIVVGTKSYRNSFEQIPKSLVIITLGNEEIIELPMNEEWEYLNLLQANQTNVIALLNDLNTHHSLIVSFDFNGDKPSSHILWKGQAIISNFQKTKKEFLCCYEDLIHPPNIYRLSHDFTQLERISHVDPRLDTLKPPTKVMFETIVPLYNGELKKVRTTILLPEGATQGDQLPALVFFYPGAEVSKDCKAFMGNDLLTTPNFLFLNQGYALIFPDVVIKPDGFSGDPLQEIVDVLLPQVYHAAYLGYVDINHLGIAGQSYGGYGTASVIARTNLFRAAVAISGVYDLAGIYGDPDEDYTYSNQYWSEQGQGRMGHPPWSNWIRYFTNSPYCLADKIHTPFLIIHGEKDLTCHVQEAKKMFTALRRLEREVQLAVYPGQGHVISEWNRSSAIDASKRILDFFDYHLKGKEKNLKHE